MKVKQEVLDELKRRNPFAALRPSRSQWEKGHTKQSVRLKFWKRLKVKAGAK